MISHYVGVRNNPEGNFATQKNPMQKEVITAIESGAQIKLAKAMNDDIELTEYKGRFSVHSEDLYYYDIL